MAVDSPMWHAAMRDYNWLPTGQSHLSLDGFVNKASQITFSCFASVALGLIDAWIDLPGPIACLQVFLLCQVRADPPIRVIALPLIVLAFACVASVVQEPDRVDWITRGIMSLVAARTGVAILREGNASMHSSPESNPQALSVSFCPDQLGSSHDHDGGDLTEHTTNLSSSVPLRYRLIDTGVFKNHIAAQIDATVSLADDLDAGLKTCVRKGMITELHSKFIHQMRERELRVGKYRLDNEIGRGSMGVVYGALDVDRNIMVALKLFNSTNNNLMRIRREMTVIQELCHPNIVTALEVGDEDGRHFIAMELLDGETMRQKVQRRGPLNEEYTLRYSLMVAKALEQAHRRQILHRDVKPSNVMITPEGHCKLLDFGICRPPKFLREHDSLEIDGGKLVGTLGFVSPEQGQLSADVDARSDLYGLGCTMFYALTGEFYVHGETPEEKFRNLTIEQRFRSFDDYDITPELVERLSRMTAYDKADRYQHASEVVQELSLLMKQRGILPPEIVSHVLIVDEIATEARITEKLLRRGSRSFEIAKAQTFQEAAKQVQRHREMTPNPLMVMIELDLPDSPLDRTIARLGHLISEQVGVIALCESANSEIRRRCLAAGCVDYLPKSDFSSRKIERAVFAGYGRLRSKIR